MGLDVIIVLSLALLLFGGAGCLIWKERKREKLQIVEPMQERLRQAPERKDEKIAS